MKMKKQTKGLCTPGRVVEEKKGLSLGRQRADKVGSNIAVREKKSQDVRQSACRSGKSVE